MPHFTNNYILTPACPAYAVEGSIVGKWSAAEAGNAITITCKHKHLLMGEDNLMIGKEAVITCQDDGTWSDHVECRRVSKLFLQTYRDRPLDL